MYKKFEEIPDVLNTLLIKVDYLTSIVTNISEDKCNEKTEYMNTESVIEYATKERGVPMSKSKLYKKTAKGLIPYRKVGKSLVFSRREIDEWLEQSMTSLDEIRASAVNAVVKSAQLKERRAK